MAPFLISIGDNTTLTGTMVLTHDASTKKPFGYTKMAKVSVGSNCFIGMGSIILPGVAIGDNVIVGAGSVVTHDIPSNSVAAGNPCRVIRGYNEYMETQKNKMTESNTVDKYPQYLSQEEIAQIKDKIDGTWYIR